MMERRWELDQIEPGAKLDRKVLRRMQAVAAPSRSRRSAARPLLVERTVYAVLIAVYALYAAVRTVQIFDEARATRRARAMYVTTAAGSSG